MEEEPSVLSEKNGEGYEAVREDEPRRRRRLIPLLLLLIAVVAVTSVGIFWWLTRDEVKTPFVAPAGVTVPQFIFTIDGIAEPVAVAASPLGDRIFVAEGAGDRLIRVFDRDGNYLSTISLLQTPLELRAPDALLVGTDNRLYVVDTIGHEIMIFTLDGQFLGKFLPDNDPDFEWFPLGLTMDEAGNLYVTDQTENRHRVLVFDPAGNLIMKFGLSGKGEGMFLFPTDVVVDDSGQIFVADSANSRVQAFDSNGEFLNVIYGTDLSLPRAMIIDNDGRLHVLDSLGHSVAGIRLDDPPGIEFRYGAPGREAGEFYFPSDLARDETGRLYIADRFNNRVQVFSF